VTSDLIEAALCVAEALESCGLRYLVGGSIASSVGGEPRFTKDVDMVIEIAETDVDRFIEALGSEFYADSVAVRRAVRLKSVANVIHQPSSAKVDLFVAGGSVLDVQQLDRRTRAQVSSNPSRYLYVYTPEDILLQKLRGFRLGGEVSDQQWRDVLSVLLVQGRAIDRDYLQGAAAQLGVTDLLDRTLKAVEPLP
jgi:hypothetical protein